MKKIQLPKPAKIFTCLIIFIFICAGLASLIQSDFGKIEVKNIQIVDEKGHTITGKLYRPMSATEKNRLPGVILCHGMNNDKETEATVALELARQGIVALSVDQLNHGDSEPGMDVIGDFLLGGDENENVTLGANAMYQYLKNTPFIDGSQMGIIGHSMGGSTARILAKVNPDHRAVVIQAGGPDNLTELNWMHNYLDIWPIYEELFIEPMESRADFILRGKHMIRYNTALIGETPKADSYDQNYGNFSAGTAQRYALCECTHPGVTWNTKSIRETVAWMLQALKGEPSSEEALNKAANQTYLIKETLLLIALITAFIAIIPLADLFFIYQKFKPLQQPLPKAVPNEGKAWWRIATINTLIGGLTFIIFPGVGMVIGGGLAYVLPIFRLLTGNGSLFWLLINAWICHKLFTKWFNKTQAEKGLTLADMGVFDKILEKDPKALSENQEYLKTALLLTAIIFIVLYAIVTIIQSYLLVELRFMWPVFKEFTPLRFGLFLAYLLPVYIFFKINGGKFMFGELRMKEEATPAKTQLIWWLKYIFAMEAGLFLVFLIQYMPMFLFKTGPGLSFGLLVFLFGLFGIFSFQVLPQFALIFFVMVAIYRRTGKIYLPAFIATVLTTWIMAVSGMLV